MKKIILTGAGGAIGAHFIAHIMENTDWEIVATDSFRHKGYCDRIQEVIKDKPEWIKRLTLITHDLVAPFTPREKSKFGNIDYIINLASISDVSASIEDPVGTIRNNTELILNMLELAKEIKPKAFIQFSTDEVMGSSARNGGHPEWSTILPSNPYSASKASQEAICIAYWRSYNVPVIITNTMNNFGEMQAPSKYPAMIQQKLENNEKVTVHAASDGQIGTRYYIHSRNAADATLFILQNTKPYMHKPGEVDKPDRYNIVGDVQLDNLEIAQRIAKLMEKKLNYELVDFHSKQPGHDLHYGLDGTKLKELGWTPPMTFDESMKKTIDWQRNNPDWMTKW